jgi:hypothetical protein
LRVVAEQRQALVHQLRDAFRRLGLPQADVHLEEIAAYHSRWVVEMDALRARLEQLDATRDAAAGSDDYS